MAHEVEVVGDHHDGVSRRDAGHRDEADEGGDAHIVEGLVSQQDPADQGERNVAEENLEGEDGGAEVEEEEKEVILNIVKQSEYNEIKKRFDKLNDYERIQLIQKHKEEFITTDEKKEEIFKN